MSFMSKIVVPGILCQQQNKILFRLSPLAVANTLNKQQEKCEAQTIGGKRMLSNSGYIGFRNPGARISESSVFMQNGTKISELPLIVKKVKDIFELYKW